MALHFLISKLKGGSGSGDWGHVGRPGKVGGSGGGGGLAVFGLPASSTIEERRTATSRVRDDTAYKKPNEDELNKHYAINSACDSNPADCKALRRYMGEDVGYDSELSDSGHINTNELLRNNLSWDMPGYVKENVNKSIARMDNLIDNMPRTPSNMKVYRTVSASPTMMQKLKPGTVFQDEGFASTTINKSYKHVSPVNTGKLQMEIRVPKGSKGVYVEPLADMYAGAQELLLARNSKFRILKNTGSNIVAELIND